MKGYVCFEYDDYYGAVSTGYESTLSGAKVWEYFIEVTFPKSLTPNEGKCIGKVDLAKIK